MKQKQMISILLVCVFVVSLASNAFALNPVYSHSEEYKSSDFYTRLCNVSLTGNHRTDILNVALSQVGYREGSSPSDYSGWNNGSHAYNNYCEYNYNYYGKNHADAWCAVFVSWCARQAQVPTSILKNSTCAGCSASYFNIPYQSGSNYTPKPGDLFFTSGWTHVGLVVSVSGDSFVSVEGNAGNGGTGVISQTRKGLSNYYFGTPNYNSTGATVTVPAQPAVQSQYPQIGLGSSGSAVKTMQGLLNKVAGANLAVDGIFGNASLVALKNYQKSRGLAADGICGAMTWAQLIKDSTAPTTPPATSAPSTSTPTSYPQIAYGSSGEAVKTMQTMLNKVIDAGLTVDGVFGAKSLSAVKNYQTSRGLAADGICGVQTWAKLSTDYNNASNASAPSNTTQNVVTQRVPIKRTQVANGSQGSEVKLLQNYLNRLIGAGLTEDGIFGNNTANAVKKYQSSRGLAVDGICGTQTWAKIDSELGNDIVTKTETVAAPSTLSISSGKYSPGTLSLGSTYSINGTVSSNYNISEVTVGIYDANGNKYSAKTVCPNKLNYNIYGVDSYIRFGALSVGTYVLKVTAKDTSGANKTLVNSPFKVVGRTENVLSASKYEKMANATHEKQGSKMCVLTSFALLLKSKLYCEGDAYSDITQNTIKAYNNNQLSCYWSTVCNNINSYSSADSNITYAFRSKYSAQENIDYIIQMLKSRPEGVLAYFYANGSNQHAVRICNYDEKTGTFYVSDPGMYTVPYTTLDKSLICNGYYSTLRGSYSNVFRYLNCVAYFN